MNETEASSSDDLSVEAVLDRVRTHTFHPVDETSFTVDRTLEEHGIADLDDDDWRVRLLAVRDLVRLGDAKTCKLPYPTPSALCASVVEGRALMWTPGNQSPAIGW